MGCGYALGPLTLVAVGTERLAPFAVAVGAFALCALVLTAVARGLPGFDGGEDGGNVLGFAFSSPGDFRRP